MDEMKKSEFRDKQVEEALASKLGNALNRLSPRDAALCPDADLIAAYRQGSLQPVEIALWESHFAECSRCRKILNVLASVGDAPHAENTVAELGISAVAKTRPSGESESGKKSGARVIGWPVRWLAPALGVAAVVALWFVVRPPWKTTGPNPSETLVAQAPMNDVQQEQALRDQTPASKVEPEQKTNSEHAAKDEFDVSREKKSLTESARTSEQTPVPMAPPPPPRANADMGTSENSTVPLARAQGELGKASALEAGPSPKQSVTSSESTPVIETTNGTLAGANRPESAANVPLNGRDFQSLIALAPAGENALMLKSTSGSTLWRAGKNGNIERSTTGGVAWVSQASPSREDWLAGKAVSNAVCWLAGRNGAIARTTNGKDWQGIASPVQAATSGKMPDWTGVAARDALNATITAGDGRRFITQDGGKTWQAQ